MLIALNQKRLFVFWTLDEPPVSLQDFSGGSLATSNIVRRSAIHRPLFCIKPDIDTDLTRPCSQSCRSFAGSIFGMLRGLNALSKLVWSIFIHAIIPYYRGRVPRASARIDARIDALIAEVMKVAEVA